jgi:hypothetical protein
MSGFLTALTGTFNQKLEEKHAKEEEQKKARREDLWKIINDPTGQFSDDTRQKALEEWQKGLNPEAKKSAGKFAQIFQKLRPPGQQQQPAQNGQPAQPQVAQQPAAAQPAPNPQRGPMQAPAGAQQPAQAPQPQASTAPPAQSRSPMQPPAQPAQGQPPMQIVTQDEKAAREKAADDEKIRMHNEEAKGTNQAEILRDKERMLAEQAAALEKEKQEMAAGDAYQATLPPGEQEQFKKWRANKRFLGTANPEKTGNEEDVKNIPGSAVIGKVDAFGNPTSKDAVYTRSKDGRLYPEAPPPKAEAPENPEVRERTLAYVDQGVPEADAKKRARSDWVKEQNKKAEAVQVRINNAPGSSNLQTSDEDLRTLADREIHQSIKPIFGRGADPNRTRYNAILAEQYRNDPDAASAASAYKAGSANLTQLTKVRGTVSSFEDAFKLDLGNAEEAAKAVPRSSAKLFNSWSQLASANLTDNPDLAAFRVATQTAINQYARLMFSATGGGTSTDSARAHAEDLLNTAMAKGTYAAALGQMKKEVANRVTGLDDEIDAQKKKMSGGGRGQPLTPPSGAGKDKDPLGILK